MINNILIPIGELGIDEDGVRYVAQVFPKANFHVVSVINILSGGIQLTDLYFEELMNSAQQEVQKATRILEGEGIQHIQTSITKDFPSKYVVKYAFTNNIDLIILQINTHRVSEPIYRVNSHLRDVIKNSHIPLLLLKDQLEKVPLKNILFATDGTRKSQKAKNFSIVLSSYLHCNLNVLHILLKNEKKNHGMAILNDVEWKASFMGGTVTKILENGDVLEKISDHVQTNDILILGIEKKLLLWHKLGPIAQSLIASSSVPLILVH